MGELRARFWGPPLARKSIVTSPYFCSACLPERDLCASGHGVPPPAQRAPAREYRPSDLYGQSRRVALIVLHSLPDRRLLAVEAQRQALGAAARLQELVQLHRNGLVAVLPQVL